VPYLSDAQLTQQLALRDQPKDGQDASGNAAVEVAAMTLSPLPMMGGMGAAGVVGFLRSKLGNPTTGEWKVPGTPLDVEAGLAGVLTLVAFFGKHLGVDQQWRGMSAVAAFGIGSHYFGELGKKYGKTGQMDWSIGSGVPPFDPTSWDPTQHADPHADPQAMGLSASGV
jgi:hypothetical protein